MKKDIIEKAAIQFGNGDPVIQPMGNGPIHYTFKVIFGGNDHPIVLQCISQRSFSQPENIIQNYQLLYTYLENKPGGLKIPALVPTLQKKLFWVDAEDNFWKASRFVSNSFSLQRVQHERDAYSVARSFASFTDSLNGINMEDLHVMLPDFHNLHLRYQEFEEAISKATIMRLLRSTHLISELRQRKKFVAFYNGLNNETDYPTRLMHHDSKIENILFDQTTGKAICPVDLDTVMPGKFFCDLGDMIRTMVCPVDENSTAWEDITVRSEYYFAIICGYLDGICHLLTKTEKEKLHYSGLLMTYMQSMRFVTDFLNNDIYYKTSYPEQNLNRALNQFILLEQLEEFLEKKYHFTVVD